MISTMSVQIRRRAHVRQIMGMPISIHVRAHDPDRPEVVGAVERAFAHLQRVDRVLSTWRADLCLEAEERTDGLFAAWRALPLGRAVFDPTGLVKGWGVEGAAAHLELAPKITWSIGAGGDIVCGTGRGMRDQDPVWRIGIEDARQAGRIVDVVPLSRGAIATSGSAARGAHIRDPRTGRALDHPGSVSVTGPRLLWADVWATAAYVDPTRAARLIQERDPAYRLINHL